jgi:hypothetical protein
LIVGGRDYAVIRLNEAAYARLRCLKQIVIVPGATHLFEEPGALELERPVSLPQSASAITRKVRRRPR